MEQVAEIEAKKTVDYLRKEKAEQAEKGASRPAQQTVWAFGGKEEEEQKEKEETRRRRDQPRRQETA